MKEKLIIYITIISIVIILLLFIFLKKSKKCEKGFEYSDSCKKCIKECDPKQTSTWLLKNDQYACHNIQMQIHHLLEKVFYQSQNLLLNKV